MTLEAKIYYTDIQGDQAPETRDEGSTTDTYITEWQRDFTFHYQATQCDAMPGDIDGSGAINILDIVSMVNLITNPNPEIADYSDTCTTYDFNVFLMDSCKLSVGKNPTFLIFSSLTL